MEIDEIVAMASAAIAEERDTNVSSIKIISVREVTADMGVEEK